MKFLNHLYKFKNINNLTKYFFEKWNVLFFFFLLSCFLSRLNSQFFIIDLFGHLIFQILVGGILLFFVLLILKRVWTSLICIIFCILLTIDILSPCKQCNAFLKDQPQNYNKIRLMTFNVSHKNQMKDFEKLLALILFEKPDVILFQEFTPQVQDKIKSLKPYFPYDTGIDKPMNFIDSVILSKYPLKNSKVGNNHALITNLILDNTELTIIGIHLWTPILPNEFNLAIEGMETIKTLITNNNQNLILMGDLNMTSTSKRFTTFLKETNLYTYTSYKNPTSTWPTILPNFLGIQIDHVLFSKNFKVIRKKTTNHFGSNHRPLIVDLAF